MNQGEIRHLWRVTFDSDFHYEADGGLEQSIAETGRTEYYLTETDSVSDLTETMNRVLGDYITIRAVYERLYLGIITL